MARDDPHLPIVLGGVVGQLEDLVHNVLEHCRHVREPLLRRALRIHPVHIGPVSRPGIEIQPSATVTPAFPISLCLISRCAFTGHDEVN